MRPDDPTNRRVGTPLIPQRSLLQPPHPPARNTDSQAAANVVRGQLNSIYSGNTSTPTPQTTPVAVAQDASAQTIDETLKKDETYGRTHASDATDIQEDQWKKYHSAWQEYYQKYYERYYVTQVYQARQALEAKAAETKIAHAQPQASRPTEVLTKEEAVHDLKGRLLENIKTSAKKVRKSRHFVPITAALCVMLVFVFLQYNRVIFANVAAYISPGDINPANIIVDPSTDVVVSNDPKLIIPKINVDVPVDYTAQPDYNSQMQAMSHGVAYFGIPGANSKPGQIGNTVLAGHSSNDLIDPGSYKFIFARLDQLTTGDAVYLNYNGKRYMYTVTSKSVVKPTDVQALIYKTDKPILTLLTCTPLGTALNRLLVTAEQVSPDPKNATPAPSNGSSGTPASIPGNSPTIVERLFGGNGN